MHATVPEPSVSLITDDWFYLVFLAEVKNFLVVIVNDHTVRVHRKHVDFEHCLFTVANPIAQP
jgi:hypothetical protein